MLRTYKTVAECFEAIIDRDAVIDEVHNALTPAQVRGLRSPSKAMQDLFFAAPRAHVRYEGAREVWWFSKE